MPDSSCYVEYAQCSNTMQDLCSSSTVILPFTHSCWYRQIVCNLC